MLGLAENIIFSDGKHHDNRRKTSGKPTENIRISDGKHQDKRRKTPRKVAENTWISGMESKKI